VIPYPQIRGSKGSGHDTHPFRPGLVDDALRFRDRRGDLQILARPRAGNGVGQLEALPRLVHGMPGRLHLPAGPQADFFPGERRVFVEQRLPHPARPRPSETICSRETLVAAMVISMDSSEWKPLIS
jgi:hypothetical protein